MRWLPNALAIARAIAVAPVVLLLGEPGLASWALAVFCAAALTDAVDGPIARRIGATTRWGAFLDPLADKVLVLGTLLALLAQSAVDPLLVSVIFVREPVVTAVRALVLRRGRIVGSSGYGKAKAAVQSVAVGAQLVAFAFPELGVRPAADAMLAAAAAMTVATAAGVIRRGLADLERDVLAATRARVLNEGR